VKGTSLNKDSKNRRDLVDLKREGKTSERTRIARRLRRGLKNLLPLFKREPWWQRSRGALCGAKAWDMGGGESSLNLIARVEIICFAWRVGETGTLEKEDTHILFKRRRKKSPPVGIQREDRGPERKRACEAALQGQGGPGGEAGYVQTRLCLREVGALDKRGLGQEN